MRLPQQHPLPPPAETPTSPTTPPPHSFGPWGAPHPPPPEPEPPPCQHEGLDILVADEHAPTRGVPLARLVLIRAACSECGHPYEFPTPKGKRTELLKIAARPLIHEPPEEQSP